MFTRTTEGLSLIETLSDVKLQLLEEVEGVLKALVEANTPEDTGLLKKRLSEVVRDATSVSIGPLDGLRVDDPAPRHPITNFITWYYTEYGGSEPVGGKPGQTAWWGLRPELKELLREERVTHPEFGGPYASRNPFYFGAVENALVPGTDAHAGFADEMVDEMEALVEQAIDKLLAD